MKDMRKELEQIFLNNKEWAAGMIKSDPNFFTKLTKGQLPQFLWIGCADSRVPANEIIGLPPGEVFVHRNVANLVSMVDFNCLSVLQYAVEILEVRHIIVTGHYGCGGVTAAVNDTELGLVDNWLSPISEMYSLHEERLRHISDRKLLIDKMCEINVVTQVRNLCRTRLLRKAWENGQPIAVHGLIYGLKDGILHDLLVNTVSYNSSEAVYQLALERILTSPQRICD